MASQRIKALTYRVENIPWGTTKENVIRDYFEPEDQAAIKVKSLFPSVGMSDSDDDPDYTATIFFRPLEPRPDGPRAVESVVTIDKDFYGFTTLYSPPKDKGPITADIIAVTGLAGHAYGSWANSDEHMWLRDYLPKDAPTARIITYGYGSQLEEGSSASILQDHTTTFLNRLIDIRESGQCESRPIIFVGHSLGCLIIKKAMCDVSSMVINTSRLPVRAIIFFAAPHRGLNTNALQTLVKGKPTARMVYELDATSPTLADLNARFHPIVQNIDILTCYEVLQTRTVIQNQDGTWSRTGPPALMVEPESAKQHWPRERVISAHANHSQIAKLKRGESGIYNSVKAAIRHGLLSTAKMVQVAENSSPLTSYEISNRPKLLQSISSPLPPPPYLQEETRTKSDPESNSSPQIPAIWDVQTTQAEANLSTAETHSSPQRTTCSSDETLLPLSEPSRGSSTIEQALEVSSTSEEADAPPESAHLILSYPEQQSIDIEQRFLKIVLTSLHEPPLELVLDSQLTHLSVLDVKAKVGEHVQTPPDQINIFHGDEPVEDSRSMNDLIGNEHVGDGVNLGFVLQPHIATSGESDSTEIATQTFKRTLEDSSILEASDQSGQVTITPSEAKSTDPESQSQSQSSLGLELAEPQTPDSLQTQLDDFALRQIGAQASLSRTSTLNQTRKPNIHVQRPDSLRTGEGVQYVANAPPNVSESSQTSPDEVGNPQNDLTQSSSNTFTATIATIATKSFNSDEKPEANMEIADCSVKWFGWKCDSKKHKKLSPLHEDLWDADHYHCNICLNGEFDLCLSCADERELCCLGHVMIKRCVRAGQIVEDPNDRIGPISRSARRTCSRCSTKIPRSDWALNCFWCPGVTFVCQTCGAENPECRIHHEKLCPVTWHPECVDGPLQLYYSPTVEASDSPMARALKMHDHDEIHRLAQDSTILTAIDSSGNDPMHLAIRLGLIDGLKILLEYEHKLNPPLCERVVGVYSPWSPLALASFCDQAEILKCLLDHGCIVNESSDRSALHAAASGGRKSIIEELLRRGAEVDALSSSGTPLIFAVRSGIYEIVRIFLAAGANVNAASNMDARVESIRARKESFPNNEVIGEPLAIAADAGFRDIVKLLLEYEAKIDTRCYLAGMPSNAMQQAVRKGHIEICQDFIDRGTDVSRLNQQRWNLVSIAAAWGRVDMVDFLLLNGASGYPPPALHGKWRNLGFRDEVDNFTRKSILARLRAVKYQ